MQCDLLAVQDDPWPRAAGGPGGDGYAVYSRATQVIEAEGEGVDTVRATCQYILPDHVENLILTGGANNQIGGTGNALDNAITGNESANTLNGLSFGLADDRPLMDAARKEAVADAAARAALYAEAAGVKLGRVMTIAEAGGYAPPRPMAMEAGFAKAADVPVAPGELTISASVSVVYEIAPE